MTTVLVDAYGGDNAPLSVLEGAVMAVKELGLCVVLTGNEAELTALAKEHNWDLQGISIVNTTDVMPMEDHPKTILREHKESSMAVALRLLSEGKGDAVVSAGSTGALLMGGTFIVKRIKGISRPALATIMPSDKDPVMLIDAGANADSRPEMLMQFAHMASIYMAHMFRKEAPKVGLLNIGTEETKGGELQLAVFPLLKNSQLNFIGNVEARDVLTGMADVIVADGYSGNILLKAIEGTASMIMKNLKKAFKTTVLTKLGALLAMPGLKQLKKSLSASEHGGAVLLGVTKPVIKAHGNSDARAIFNAIRVAGEFAQSGVIEEITTSAEKLKEQEADNRDG